MLCADENLDGDRAALEKNERAVYRWTSEENPTGMDDENAERVARVLELPSDTFKPEAYVLRLEEENRRLTAEREERLDRLEADVQELRSRLESQQP